MTTYDVLEEVHEEHAEEDEQNERNLDESEDELHKLRNQKSLGWGTYKSGSHHEW